MGSSLALRKHRVDLRNLFTLLCYVFKRNMVVHGVVFHLGLLDYLYKKT